MATINPAVLGRRRAELKLSLDDIETRSGINRATIHRIERGKTGRNNQHTIAKLANALKIEVNELTASSAESDATATDEILYSRSQMNVRVSHESRNALALVGMRYGVRPVDVVEFAPLLFYIVAEESLRARQASLTVLAEARKAVQAMDGHFPHLSERLVSDWQADDIELLEETSIRKRDLLGRMLDDETSIPETRPVEYDEGEHNPFVAHLRTRLAVLESEEAPAGAMEDWYDGWPPRYLICRPEALDYFGGDEEIADDIVNGIIGLHELPREMRALDQQEARVAWARARIKETAERQVDLLDLLDVKAIQL